MAVDKEDLYILKINCKGKRTVGKADQGISVEKIIIDFKIYYYYSYFYTFIPLFAFPTVLFPLQLIFTVYKSYLPLFNFAYLFFLSFLSSQHIC